MTKLSEIREEISRKRGEIKVLEDKLLEQADKEFPLFIKKYKSKRPVSDLSLPLKIYYKYEDHTACELPEIRKHFFELYKRYLQVKDVTESRAIFNEKYNT